MEPNETKLTPASDLHLNLDVVCLLYLGHLLRQLCKVSSLAGLFDFISKSRLLAVSQVATPRYVEWQIQVNIQNCQIKRCAQKLYFGVTVCVLFHVGFI